MQFFKVLAQLFPCIFSTVILLQLKNVQPKYNLKDLSTSLNQILSSFYYVSSHLSLSSFKEGNDGLYLSFVCSLPSISLSSVQCVTKWSFSLLVLFGFWFFCYVVCCFTLIFAALSSRVITIHGNK